MTIFIGIDPGKSGSISAIYSTGKFNQGINLSETHGDIWNFWGVLISSIKVNKYSNSVIYLEKVHSMPGQGVSSTFKFGQSYGFCQCLCTASKIKFKLISPSMWQRGVGIIKIKGESPTQKKNRHKDKAQQLFPELKITHKNADSLLIAEYCRMKEF